ncbi:hypothetical protein QPK60_21500, partial [Aeromonas caviae]|uniref:hypothetical protein n=1 Tax=Aeromonas caviae TaxID=648 RepID=UPI0025415E90
MPYFGAASRGRIYFPRDTADDIENKKRGSHGCLSFLLARGAGIICNRYSAPDLGINLPIALTQYLQNDLLV